MILRIVCILAVGSGRQIELNGEKLQGFADAGIDYPFDFYSGPEGLVSFMRPKTTEFCAAPEAGAESMANLANSGTEITDGFAIPIYVDTFRKPTDALEQNIPSDFWFYPDEGLMELARKVLDEGVELANSGVDASGQDFELEPHPVFKVWYYSLCT